MSDDTATVVEGYEPGTSEWMTRMSASKVACALGIAPASWDSPFTLWHRMKGHLPPIEDRPELEFGRDAEPMIVDWFARQRPELTIHPTATFEREGWMLATPDRLIDDDALLEVKTAVNEWEWRIYDDEDGGWERGLPAHYEAQVQWQLLVTGREKAYVAVLFGNFAREWFEVTPDPDTQELLETAMRAFVDSLTADVPPPVDDNAGTTLTLKHLHPDIDDVDVEVDGWFGWRVRQAKREHEHAESVLTRVKNEALDAMGNARRLTTDNRWITRRQPGRGGVSLYINTR